MSTLTQLEDILRCSNQQAEGLLTQLSVLHGRLENARNQPEDQQQYQQNTLLLESVIQAEDIIRIIYFRYHNQTIIKDE